MARWRDGGGEGGGAVGVLLGLSVVEEDFVAEIIGPVVGFGAYGGGILL